MRHVLLLAHGESADRDSRPIAHGERAFDGFEAKVLVGGALDDGKEKTVVAGIRIPPRFVTRPAPRQPGERAFDRGPRGLGGGLPGGTFVERHADVGADRGLDLHREFRREPVQAPVQVAAEGDALVVDPVDAGEREDLEPARVGEDGTVPSHEPVESAESLQDARARPQVEVIGVPEQDLDPRVAEFPGRERFHRSERPDGHEARGVDRAARQAERPGARPPARPLDEKAPAVRGPGHAVRGARHGVVLM